MWEGGRWEGAGKEVEERRENEEGGRDKGGLNCRGGHRHWQVGRMPDTNLKPDLPSKEVKDGISLAN